MEKDNIVKYLNRLETKPPVAWFDLMATTNFAVEDTVEGGEGWIRVRCPAGRLAIWVHNGHAHQIMGTGDGHKWSCTKENIEYAIELYDGLCWE